MTRPRLVLGIALAILALLLFYLAVTILASRQPVEIAGTASLSPMRTPASTSMQSPLPTLPYITQISPLANPTRVAASPTPLGPQIYLPDIGAGADTHQAQPTASHPAAGRGSRLHHPHQHRRPARRSCRRSYRLW